MRNLQKFLIVMLICATTNLYAEDKKPASRPSSSKPPASKPPASKPTTSSKPTSTPSPSMKPPASRPNVEAKKPDPPKERQPLQRPNIESKKPEPIKEVRPAPIKSVDVETSKIERPAASRPNVVKPEEQVEIRKGNSVKPNSNPDKPTVKFDAIANTAQKKADSAKAYQAANPQPKPVYKTPTGQNVEIKPTDVGVKTVRDNLNSEKYSNRTVRVEHHYHDYYGDRYDYYRSRPYIDIGGGYSTLFWYSMLDWSVERRAMWMYNNQNLINQQVYQQQLSENAQLRTEIEALRLKGQSIDPHYVDSEFKENPDLMYSDEYVHAVYNPTPVVESAPRPVIVSQPYHFPVWGLFWSFVVIGFVTAFIYLVFFHDWKV